MFAAIQIKKMFTLYFRKIKNKPLCKKRGVLVKNENCVLNAFFCLIHHLSLNLNRFLVNQFQANHL